MLMKKAGSLEVPQKLPHSSLVLETDSGTTADPATVHICSLVPGLTDLSPFQVFSVSGNFISSSVVGELALLYHLFLQIFFILHLVVGF